MTCRQLGYDHGLSVCCGAYGYSYDTGIIDKVNCSGNEKSLLNCTAQPPVAACHQDYAAVACYNGQLPSKNGKSAAKSIQLTVYINTCIKYSLKLDKENK